MNASQILSVAFFAIIADAVDGTAPDVLYFEEGEAEDWMLQIANGSQLSYDYDEDDNLIPCLV